MHPNAAFSWIDGEQMLHIAREQGFAHIFAAADDGLFVVHVPVLVVGGRIQFHVSRRNRAAQQLAGRTVLISIVGRHGYQSANWYASTNQVPTWHYEALEIEGPARQLPHDELVAQLDALSDLHERRVEPSRPWTREKMEPGAFEAMTNAIIGFEVEPAAMRGTRKFNQHKSADDLAATVAGQERAGRGDIACAIRELGTQPIIQGALGGR